MSRVTVVERCNRPTMAFKDLPLGPFIQEGHSENYIFVKINDTEYYDFVCNRVFPIPDGDLYTPVNLNVEITPYSGE